MKWMKWPHHLRVWTSPIYNDNKIKSTRTIKTWPTSKQGLRLYFTKTGAWMVPAEGIKVVGGTYTGQSHEIVIRIVTLHVGLLADGSDLKRVRVELFWVGCVYTIEETGGGMVPDQISPLLMNVWVAIVPGYWCVHNWCWNWSRGGRYLLLQGGITPSTV